MRYELWSYDEYGQGSIVSSSENIEDVIQKGRSFVTQSNVENALAATDRETSWEAYFPLVYKGKTLSKDVFYGGNKKTGKHSVWVKDGKKWKQEEMGKDQKVRFFLGTIKNGKTETDWFLQSDKKEEVSSFKDEKLHGKTVLFIKVVI